MKSIDSIAKNTPKEYRLVTLLVDPTQINDALQRYPDCPTEVKQWATSAIVWVCFAVYITFPREKSSIMETLSGSEYIFVLYE